MGPDTFDSARLPGGSAIAWEDGERVFRRSRRCGDDGQQHTVFLVQPAAEFPSRAILDRLAHEYQFKDQLQVEWAVRPLALASYAGRTTLVLEDAGNEPLSKLLGLPMEIGRFLELAVAIAATVRKLHECGFVHKDIKPFNLLITAATAEAKLTGFGMASRLARERLSPHPPETIAGTLAYMAPEQTGRMNRSVDSRSDLYALGITFYQMVTGSLPFTALDPMEWVHAHLAKRPLPPRTRVREIPTVVSAIIMKLLAKMAEDRYQTAHGLETDLRRCQVEWQSRLRIDDFPLGERDASHRLQIPEKLYGRQREVEALLAAFNRIANGGAPELVLVSGYSGIGKSSVVNELQPTLASLHGLFAAGKFDQYKRDVPYSTLAQAFQGLVRPLLGKSTEELASWGQALREALGPNGQLMVDLVPELKLIIGEQSSISELSPQDAQRRFQLAFRRFLATFARPEHPLVLFLDDLQWLDPATIDLLEDLLTSQDTHHLLLIGAYRDNEVTAAHLLLSRLEAVRAARTVQDIKLGPLATEDLKDLVADSLRIDTEQAAPLAEVMQAKTDGNPFFAIQFLHVLADEGFLIFDQNQAKWSFDLAGIHAKQYTDNVVELLAGKLVRLPHDTQEAMRLLACIGNAADIATLSIVLGTSEEQAHAALWEGLSQQMIERRDHSYKFTHDRIQEASYALIPEASRAGAHLTIGRLLAAHTPPDKRDETIFDIVHQLNRATTLITSRGEREQVAELNLAAGKRAVASSAFASARAYLATGRALLSEETWHSHQTLAFDLEVYSASCDIFFGALQEAEERLTKLATRAADSTQLCDVARRSIELYSTLGKSERAVSTGLECLREVGFDWPMHPTEALALSEYRRTWARLGSHSVEDILDMPSMRDPEARAILDVLAAMNVPSHNVDENLHVLIVSRAVDICLEHGNSDAAPVSYSALGVLACTRFGDHDQGYRLGKMACSMIEFRGPNPFGGGRTYSNFAVLAPWRRPLSEAIDPARRAFQLGKDEGRPAIAALAARTLIWLLLASGRPLEEVEREAELAGEFVLPFGFYLDRISAPLALIRTLRGRTAKFGSLDDERFTESSYEGRLTGNPEYAFLESSYWIRKLQARFFACDYDAAVYAADKADAWYETSPALSIYLTEMADFYFYAALSRAALCKSADCQSYAKYHDALQRHGEQFKIWARICPQNFEDRAALIDAETARIEGRLLDAMDQYEHAIMSARTNGFIHYEAIACEFAGRFYASRSSDTIANVYLRQARSCYLRWGADGKVRQLEMLYPFIHESGSGHSGGGTIAVPGDQLDFATVVKVSQAVSGEMVLGKLIDALMRLAVEHAGAERGLLLLSRGNALRLEAEATTSGDGITVHRQDQAAAALPNSIVQYAMRSREIVLLDDASAHSTYSTDSYVREQKARSILCLPLVIEAKIMGVLYLENNLTPHAFTPDRVTVLKVLASQAAISLENSYAQEALRESERSLRSAIDGIPGFVAILATDGDVEVINRQIVEYCGLALDELRNWGTNGIIHPEDLPRLADVFAKSIAAGIPYEFEARLRRFDGEYRWFEVRGIPVRDTANRIARWYVLLTDIEDRTQALERLQQMQSDFARMNRVSMMGELAASLSHEITQPIASARNNARAALNFLEKRPLDLSEVREALGCAVGDADRAGDIINRIRDQVRKMPPRKYAFDLNEAVEEVLGLARSAIVRHSVAVQSQLSASMLPVHGDRVQLQQVILNLLLNAVEAMASVEAGARQLIIHTEQDETCVVFAVRDSGPGIDPALAGRIFEPFYTSKSGGTGMGLPICRSIIDAHGGRLWADANKPQGAVFRFRLPNSEPDL